MRIVADENVDSFIVRRLRSDGHTIAWILEDNPSIDDERVLSIAYAQDALLVTKDKGFGELVFVRRLPTAGVLLVRMEDLSYQERADKISWVLKTVGEDLRGKFSTLTDTRFRSQLIA